MVFKIGPLLLLWLSQAAAEASFAPGVWGKKGEQEQEQQLQGQGRSREQVGRGQRGGQQDSGALWWKAAWGLRSGPTAQDQFLPGGPGSDLEQHLSEISFNQETKAQTIKKKKVKDTLEKKWKDKPIERKYTKKQSWRKSMSRHCTEKLQYQ